MSVATLRARLVRPLAEFGDVSMGELRTGEIAAWEATLPPRFRYAVVRARTDSDQPGAPAGPLPFASGADAAPKALSRVR